ncbi:MAG TPA: hypothetical protein VLL75_20800 [Vicinamibacteria bacterium]|nr:hypothetical protein [Vicinamibacteria bacterium]
MLTWVGRLGLPVYLAYLVYRALHGAPAEPVPFPPVAEIGAPAALLRLLRELLLRGLLEAARFAPLGLLAALGMPRREGFFERVLGMTLPALVVSAAAAVGVAVVEGGRPFTMPGLFELALPGLGVLFGVWVGMALHRGLIATLSIPLKIVVWGFLLGVLAAGLAWRALEPAPLPFEPARVSSPEKRRLYGLFRSRNPVKLREGETAELRLTPRDLDLLMAWGLSVGEPGRKSRVAIAREQAILEASFRVPRVDRYLNVVARGGASIRDGSLDLSGDELQIGLVRTPRVVLGPLTYLVERALNGDRRARPLLAAVRSLDLEEDALRVVYGRAPLPRGFLADLFHGEGTGAEDLASLRAQLDQMTQGAGRLPTKGDARFGAAVQSAFALAAGRSGADGAVRENRAAILALGLVLGTDRLETFTGRVAPEADLAGLKRAYKGSTLRSRSDWAKHFTVSAALAVLSVDQASDAVGLLKEELDANGGSGFSFGDLLADRAGTTFAVSATRDLASARALQARLANGFRLDDFFPSADGLPEDIQDAELKARYGGVGGKEYRRVVDEIERRIASLPAYRR